PMPGAVPPGSKPIHLSADCYFLRLWIQNDGNVRAEKVQVFVSELHRETANGTFVKMESFIPMNLRWSFGNETPTHTEVFADGISPGMGVHCNLAYVLDPSATSGRMLCKRLGEFATVVITDPLHHFLF